MSGTSSRRALIRDLFIHELFAAQAAQRPEAVAVVFENNG